MRTRRGKKKIRMSRIVVALALVCAMAVPVSMALAGESQDANSDKGIMAAAEVKDLPVSDNQAAAATSTPAAAPTTAASTSAADVSATASAPTTSTTATAATTPATPTAPAASASAEATSQAQDQAQTQPQTQPNAQAQAQSQVQSQPQSRPQAQSQTQPQPQTQTDAASGPAVFQTSSANWQDDFDYSAPSGGVITLTNYKGTDSSVTVPATVTLAGVEYKTAVAGQVFNGNDTITSVTFSPGVKLKSGDGMFENCTALSQVNFTGVDANGCTTMQNMFKNCTSLTQVDLSVLTDGSDTGNMNGMFQGCVNLLSANLTGLDAALCSTVENMFAALSADQPMKLTTAKLPDMTQSFCTNMSKMFYLCESLSDVDLSGTNSLGNYTLDQIHASPLFSGLEMTMDGMFYGCKSLASLDVSGWNTNICKSMKGMFELCESLTSLDVKDWVTTSCTDMSRMFAGCTSLTDLDVSNWDASNVTTLESTFEYMPSTTIVDLSNWNVSNVAATGWNRAFGDGPKASDGAVAESQLYYTNPNQYLAFGANGDYAVLLDKRLDRVYCLNLDDDVPTGNLVTLTQVPLADIDTLTDVTYQADADDWTKIAAAIMFFGNDLSENTQQGLQVVILTYADHVSEDDIAARFDDPEKADAILARAREIKEYVENNFTRIDYSDVVVDYYARPDGVANQNLLSVETAKTVKLKDTGSLAISKSFTEGTKVADEAFQFMVKLKNEDGSAYRGDVQMTGADGELTTVTPNTAGTIALSILGAGKAMLSALPVGVTFEVTEKVLEGWILVTKSGTTGAVAKDVTATASFTNEEDRIIDPQGGDDPGTDDPVTPDPVVPDPGTDDPVTPDPVVPDPGADDPVVPDPGTDDPVTPDPGTDDPSADDPGADDPGADDPGTDDPGTDDPGNNANPGRNDWPVDPAYDDPGNQQPENVNGNEAPQDANQADQGNQGEESPSGAGSAALASSANDLPKTGDKLLVWPLIMLVAVAFATTLAPRNRKLSRRHH